VELRTREEYYDAARTADARPGQTDKDHGQAGPEADSRPDPGTDREAGTETEASGWNAVDAGVRPARDTIRIGPDRSAHILDGDAYGGGHRHGTGRPGKTEFPAGWTDQKVIDTARDIARKPDQPPVRQDRNSR
jgi:hypothetical protein